MRSTIILIILLGMSGCNKKNDLVYDKLKEQLEKQGIRIDSIDAEGLLCISKNEINLKISLENTRRDFDRDSDETAMSDLVNLIVLNFSESPDWSIAKNNIYISLFPNDFDFEEILNKKVTNEFSIIYIHSSTGKHTWISKHDFAKWNITEETLNKQANDNAQLLLDKTSITFDTIENRKLGMINAENETLKAALLFAPNMKTKIEKDFGFPFYAVIPVRDYCLIFSEKDFPYFSKKIGQIVVKEYKESGYPITTEILKFSDIGVEAVGKYDVK